MPDYHALLSPSSAHTSLECQVSIAMSIDELNTSNDAADSGTCTHTVSEMALNSGLDGVDYIGQVVKVGDPVRNVYTVDEERAERVQIYLNAVRNRIQMWETLGATVEMHVEVAVPIEHITGEEDATGTSDCVLLIEKSNEIFHIDVIDLKDGRDPVNAVDNPQGKIYILGACEKFRRAGGTASFYIVQPRISTEAVVAEYKVADLLEWSHDYVAPRAALALSHVGKKEFPLDLFNPGEKQCKYCKAKAKCPGLAEFVQKTIAMEFDEITDATVGDAVPALTVEELGDIYPKLELIDMWGKAVLAKINQLALAGESVPNVKVVRGKRGNRAWIDAQAAEQTLKSMALKVDEMYIKKLASPTVIEKALKDNPRKWKRAVALIEQKDGALCIAPEWDKRPAVEIVKVEALFDVVPAVDSPEDLI